MLILFLTYQIIIKTPQKIIFVKIHQCLKFHLLVTLVQYCFHYETRKPQNSCHLVIAVSKRVIFFSFFFQFINLCIVRLFCTTLPTRAKGNEVETTLDTRVRARLSGRERLFCIRNTDWINYTIVASSGFDIDSLVPRCRPCRPLPFLSYIYCLYLSCSSSSLSVSLCHPASIAGREN